ncbi:hypothetical protein [Microbacterium sp. G2-8]|uniref:hypothetical protein n=1 Tax=Microbacterium sp. G2-8 TaxID=2842454 RepID=UPI001C89C1FD|nr:hypothetical protein [Microbacterium sp. G2-8]
MSADTALDADAAQLAIEHCYEQGWSDGLPLVPVTQPLLDRFLAAGGRDGDEIIGDMPQTGRTVTVRTAAMNAAMAGCLPEFFPVVLATFASLMKERAARGGGWQSTSGPAPLIVVNGAVRERLGINSAGGVFGPGFRANATIARAIGLIVRNGFGVRPHELEQATQGIPGRWSILIGENEEDSPWEPLAAANGVGGDAVTTTLLRTSEFVDNRHSTDPEHLLGDLADTIGRSGSWIFAHAMAGVVLCPEHAHLLAGAGWSRRDVAAQLMERAGRTTAQLARAGKDGLTDRGVRHPGGDLAPEEFQRTAPPADPSSMLIAVAGSRTAGISMVTRYFADWSGTSTPIAHRN